MTQIEEIQVKYCNCCGQKIYDNSNLLPSHVAGSGDIHICKECLPYVVTRYFKANDSEEFFELAKKIDTKSMYGVMLL